MGRLEFYAWVDQLYREVTPQQPAVDRWDGTEGDEWWERAREKRRRLQGR